MIYVSQMLHGTGIFTYMHENNKFEPNVGRYTSPMEHMGMI